MTNFNYSEELQISIVEYRLKNIFDILTKNNLYYYSSSLIFNDSFWLLSYIDRENILKELKPEWVGYSPKQSYIFSINKKDLKVIKAIKNAYFTYTKITHDDLVNILKLKKKNQITEFKRFSELDNINNIINDLNIRSSTFKYKKVISKKLLGKKLFKQIIKKEAINKNKTQVLILSYFPSLELWDVFLKKLIKYNTRKPKKNIKFEIHCISKHSYNYIQANIQNYKYLYKLIEENLVKFEYLDLANINYNNIYDYIIFEDLLSFLPVDFIQKYNEEYFVRSMRILYKPEINQKEIKKIKKLILRKEDKIENTENILSNFLYELIWEKYQENEIVNYLNEQKLIEEYITTSFPLTAIDLTLKLLQNLKKKGNLIIIDYFDSLGINNSTIKDINKFERIPLNINVYQKILQNVFENRINIVSKNIEEFLLENKSSKEEILNIDAFLKLIISNKDIGKKFFEYNIFNFDEYLTSLEKKYWYFSILREKKIFLFGLSSLLYKLGYKKYLSEVEHILKYYDKTIALNKLKVNWFNSYKKEILFEIFPYIINKLKYYTEIPIILKEYQKNKYLNKILKKLKINPNKFLSFIKENKKIITTIKKENIIQHSIFMLSIKES